MGKRLRRFTGRAKFRPRLAGSKADHSKIAPMLIRMHVCVYNLDIA
jgi:hypothetical protein